MLSLTPALPAIQDTIEHTALHPTYFPCDDDHILSMTPSPTLSRVPTYALTTVTHQRRAILMPTANADLLVETLFHYRNAGRYRLHGFAVMPEHLHVLLTPADNQTIERCAQCIKGGFSHRLHSNFPAWQPGFHEHRVRDEDDFHHQLAYIAANPSRRRLNDHLHVHTNFADRLDPMPLNLRHKIGS